MWSITIKEFKLEICNLQEYWKNSLSCNTPRNTESLSNCLCYRIWIHNEMYRVGQNFLEPLQLHQEQHVEHLGIYISHTTFLRQFTFVLIQCVPHSEPSFSQFWTWRTCRLWSPVSFFDDGRPVTIVVHRGEVRGNPPELILGPPFMNSGEKKKKEKLRHQNCQFWAIFCQIGSFSFIWHAFLPYTFLPPLGNFELALASL